ncbi:MAG: complex I subunit 5 family protein [Methanosarcinales archaeon]
MTVGIPVEVLVLLIPLIVTFIVPIFKPKPATAISFASFIIPFFVLLYKLMIGESFEFQLLDFPGPIGEFYLFGDAISYAIGLTICIVSAMVAVYSLSYMKHRFEEMKLNSETEFKKFFFFYNFYATSMLWLVFSGNLILLYIFLEISLITSFLLIYLYGYGNRQWVAILYFIWTNIAGVLALVGFLMIAYDNSTLALKSITSIGFTAWLLIFLGMIVKLPGLGPHIWLPWAHAEAPTPVSALLSPLTVGLAGYILLRVYLVDPWFIDTYKIPILIYAIISSIYAGFSVFKQDDFKRLLAYSTVSQMGYVLIAICLGPFGLIGVVIQYISHAFGKSILFMSAGSLIAVYHGLRDIGKMGGLHEYVPNISNSALMGFMTLGGVLTVGMFGEFFILYGIVDTFGNKLGMDLIDYLWLIIAVIVVFIISGLYSFYTLRRVFYRTPKEFETPKVSKLLYVPMYIIGLIAIVFIFPPLATGLVQNLIQNITSIIGGLT